MLQRLQIRNFKCFENHTLEFHPTTSVIVGRNNAGKSSIVEALRLVSIVSSRYQFLNWRDAPGWLDLPSWSRGVSPDIKEIEFNHEATFYHYSEPPAMIEATFANGSSITVYIGLEQTIHAIIKDERGQPVKSRTEALRFSIPRISIMPQVGPVQKTENPLTPDYVRRALSSPLAPMHFRNQLRLLSEHFPEFERLAHETWSGMKIDSLINGNYVDSEPIQLLVRNEGFVADIGSMGHGLQMWLQTMWYLARTRDDATIILDEPDVYLHADLQRKLIRLLMNQNRQVIVTTHSVEIMAEVEPDNILIIERNKPVSKFASSLPAVQRIICFVGSAHNIHLARLWSARRCLLVEGKDVKILKRFQNTLFPESSEPLDAIPNMPIGGWGGWNYAVGSTMLIENSVGKNINVNCILDRDYHSDDEIFQRYTNAKTNGVHLHVWRKKEIENYLLVPETVQRLINGEISKRTSPPTLDEIKSQLDQIAEDLKDEVFDAFTHEFHIANKAKGAAGAAKAARNRVKSSWNTLDEKLSLVSGKIVISRLSEWSHREFRVEVNAYKLARAMTQNEIAEEMRTVMTAIENHTIIPSV